MNRILKSFLLLISLFFYSGIISAVFCFPQPTGHYSVGYTNHHVIDASRYETLTTHNYAKNSVFRELMIHIWYPSDEADYFTTPREQELHRYMPEVMPNIMQKVKEKFYFPVSLQKFLLGTICSYSVQNRVISSFQDLYPVIIFSHGFGGVAKLSSAHIENLVSHGYIVVGIDHTYDCMATFFPDGRRLMQNSEYKEPGKGQFQYVINRLTTWQEDVKLVLDKLADINAQDPHGRLTSRMDLNRIGMFGHSMGGITTMHMCRRDERIKAGVNLDGPALGEGIDQPHSKPLMIILADNTLERLYVPFSDKELKKRNISRDEEKKLKEAYEHGIPLVCAQAQHDIYHLSIQGTAHHTFCDLSVLKKMIYFSRYFELGVGKIDGLRVTEIINNYLVTFFDKYLKDRPSPLLDGHVLKYHEVSIKKWNNHRTIQEILELS